MLQENVEKITGNAVSLYTNNYNRGHKPQPPVMTSICKYCGVHGPVGNSRCYPNEILNNQTHEFVSVDEGTGTLILFGNNHLLIYLKS